jgi:hypothetical protein
MDHDSSLAVSLTTLAAGRLRISAVQRAMARSGTLIRIPKGQAATPCGIASRPAYWERTCEVALGCEAGENHGGEGRSHAVLLVGGVAVTACGGDKQAAETANRDVPIPLPPSELETQLPLSVREAVLTPFTGDLDELVKRRAVRVGVTFNRTFYFIDRGKQRGIAYEYGQLMEERLNTHFKTGTGNKISVIFFPLAARNAAAGTRRRQGGHGCGTGPGDARAAAVRRLQRPHQDERQADPGHRPRRADDRLP